MWLNKVQCVHSVCTYFLLPNIFEMLFSAHNSAAFCYSVSVVWFFEALKHQKITWCKLQRYSYEDSFFHSFINSLSMGLQASVVKNYESWQNIIFYLICLGGVGLIMALGGKIEKVFFYDREWWLIFPAVLRGTLLKNRLQDLFSKFPISNFMINVQINW